MDISGLVMPVTYILMGSMIWDWARQSEQKRQPFCLPYENG